MDIMYLLCLILLSPLASVSGQRYRSSSPNDEPFLPSVYPVYPYNPKLIKRGTDKDALNPDIFAPRSTVRNSYTSFNQLYPQYTVPMQSTTSSPFYNVNDYLYAYYLNPQSARPTYNYNYDQFYYPNYSQGYSTTNPSLQQGDDYLTPPVDLGKLSGKTRDKPAAVKTEIKDGQFVDGINYLSAKDLEGQYSTYRLQNAWNHLDQGSDLQVRSAQHPRMVYRLVGYENQAPRQAYPVLPAGQKFLHQVLMGHDVGKGFAQPQYDFSQQNQAVKTHQAQSFDAPVIAKTGLAYVMNPTALHVLPRHIGRPHDSYQVLDPAKKLLGESAQGIYLQALRNMKNHGQNSEFGEHSTQSGQLSDVEYKKNHFMMDETAEIQAPQAQAFQYAVIHPGNYKYPFDEVNFAAKRNIKM